MKIETLKKRKDFISSNKFGKKYYTNNFILQKNKDSNNEISNVRFGFTATKRIGNAVNRNRAKRRMRSLISLFLKNDISSFENGNSFSEFTNFRIENSFKVDEKTNLNKVKGITVNGNSYVLIAKASLIKASFVNLKNEMKNCLNRL